MRTDVYIQPIFVKKLLKNIMFLGFFIKYQRSGAADGMTVRFSNLYGAISDNNVVKALLRPVN